MCIYIVSSHLCFKRYHIFTDTYIMRAQAKIFCQSH